MELRKCNFANSKQTQIGDIILGSNDKKYKIIDDSNGFDILLMDISSSEISQGYNKEYFFNTILGKNLPLLYDGKEHVFSVEIIKE